MSTETNNPNKGGITVPPGGSGISTAPDNGALAINKISIRVPPFWKPDPTLWFCQLEAQFSINGITADATKFNTVVAHIESEILTTVSDIIRNPPPNDKYNLLKARLIECHSDTEEARLKKLLNKCFLGDKRPSDLFREMQALAGCDSGTQLLRSLWIQKLPQQIQILLSSMDEDNLNIDKLTKVADRVNETIFHGDINAISQQSNTSSQQNSNVLSQQLCEITKRLEQLCSSNFRSSRSRSNSHKRSNSRSGSKSKSDKSNSEHICWYHKRFAAKATKCIGTCNFESNQKNA